MSSVVVRLIRSTSVRFKAIYELAVINYAVDSKEIIRRLFLRFGELARER
jgi:hypothetical protein